MQELIELGAVTLMVPGNLPIGCSAAYLTYYETTNKEEYDPATGCLKWLNKFSEYHNDQLQKELSRIQALHPHVNIIYADYYNAAMRFYRYPSQFGNSTFLIICFILHLLPKMDWRLYMLVAVLLLENNGKKTSIGFSSVSSWINQIVLNACSLHLRFPCL